MSLRPPAVMLENIREFSRWCRDQRTAYQEIFYTGELTPSQITANQNNYTPTDLNAAGIVRVSSDAARDITGIFAGVADRRAGRFLKLYNVGAFTITLKDESASSLAANRFSCSGSADFSLVEAGSANLWYDNTSTRWRVT